MSEHDRWADATGAYLLGAMPLAERHDFEQHLAGCRACRREVDALAPAAEALPMASPPVDPPRALKDRVMADVEREAALLAQAGPAADRPPRRALRLPGWPRLAVAAAALLVAGVLGGVALDRTLEDGAHTVAAEVDERRAPGARAELEMNEDGATLVATGLPAPPDGRVYQVWVLREGASAPEPTDALFLPRGDGRAVAMVPGGVSGVEAVLVTDEPAGGSQAPTRAPLVTAPMS